MQSQEEPGRCTDRRNSNCCSLILSQHDERGRTCPQPQHQTSENPHLNTTQPSRLPKSCCQGNALINPAPSLGRRTCALGSQHRNLGSGLAASLHHQDWKTPKSVLNPSAKGSNPLSHPGPPTPDPPALSHIPHAPVCSNPGALQPPPKPSSQHAGTRPASPQTLLGQWGLPDSLPLMVEQDPASRPCYFLLGASSPAQGLPPQGAARSFASPQPPSAEAGPCGLQGVQVMQGEAVADNEFRGIKLPDHTPRSPLLLFLGREVPGTRAAPMGGHRQHYGQDGEAEAQRGTRAAHGVTTAL